MIDRRRFLQTLAVAATAPAIGTARSDGDAGFGKLVADAGRIIDLPAGFQYEVLARKGDEMDDGLLVPGEADGMAAFPGDNGDVILVCNHENLPSQSQLGPFGRELERLDVLDAGKIYDRGGGSTPGTGGTTTIVYDPQGRRVRRHFMSLAGTELNCAGGATPWRSWLSCEECFRDTGIGFDGGRVVRRDRRHGYVFEVPADGTGACDPVALTAMGRFEHEAAAVDPASGVVYMTEDRHRGLFYRFIPDQPGELARGGRLQALAVSSRPGFDTRNWDDAPAVSPGQVLEVYWLDLEDVDGEDNDLRFRGRDAGAAIFARGEGLCYAGGEFVMTATIGGPDRLGQLFVYRPSPNEATTLEHEQPGQLRLLAESTPSSLLRHADNVTMSPWGDLIVCEDTADHCGLVGVRPDGRQYALADNAYSHSELAGACFSPDGGTLFVNIQVNGLTLAITGPWPATDT